MKHYTHEQVDKLGLSVATNKRESVAYNGMLDVARKIYTNEGVSGFYKGLTPNLIKVFPSSGLFFLAYEGTLMLLQKDNSTD